MIRHAAAARTAVRSTTLEPQCIPQPSNRSPFRPHDRHPPGRRPSANGANDVFPDANSANPARAAPATCKNAAIFLSLGDRKHLAMKRDLRDIAARFAFDAPVAGIESLGAGFINDTFRIRTAGAGPDYILQRKNRDFPRRSGHDGEHPQGHRAHPPPRGGCRRRPRARSDAHRADPRGRPLCHTDDGGEYWTAAQFIEGAKSYDRADTPPSPARAARASAASSRSSPTSPSR